MEGGGGGVVVKVKCSDVSYSWDVRRRKRRGCV